MTRANEKLLGGQSFSIRSQNPVRPSLAYGGWKWRTHYWRPSGEGDWTLPLAEEAGLSVYDASYLELAIRLGVTLVSADRKLCEAAKRAGVALMATA